jgi:hypothetical protein
VIKKIKYLIKIYLKLMINKILLYKRNRKDILFKVIVDLIQVFKDKIENY